MKELIIQSLPNSPWMLMILLSFVGIFGTIVFNVMRPSRRRSYDAVERLPLENTDNEKAVKHV